MCQTVPAPISPMAGVSAGRYAQSGVNRAHRTAHQERTRASDARVLLCFEHSQPGGPEKCAPKGRSPTGGLGYVPESPDGGFVMRISVTARGVVGLLAFLACSPQEGGMFTPLGAGVL